MTGTKELVQNLLNRWKLKRQASPALILWNLQQIFNTLEDVHSVSGITEINQAITDIGDGAGTIFIEAGTHSITTPITINTAGSIIVYGHGDNSVLQPSDGIEVFTITSVASLVIKNIKLDLDNYTGATSAIDVNETSNNVIFIEGVTIDGDGNGYGIESQSNNVIIGSCSITNMDRGIFINNSDYHLITGNDIYSNVNGIYADTATGCVIDSGNNIYSNTQNGIYFTGSSRNSIASNLIHDNDSNTVNAQAGIYIDANSDNNTIKDNNIYDNNNSGTGTCYGLYIANSNCNENVVKDNIYSGNDIFIKDDGTITDIVYMCRVVADIQDAFDSIGSKTGIIKLLSQTYSITSQIDVDGGGEYTIEGIGLGATLSLGDSSMTVIFNITDTNMFYVRNITIDMSSGNSVAKMFNISSANVFNITIDNVIFDSASNKGNPIYFTSATAIIRSVVRNCKFTSVIIPITILNTDNVSVINNWATGSAGFGFLYISSGNNIIAMGNVSDGNTYSFYLDTCNDCIITNNIIQNATTQGIQVSTANRCIISNNIFDNAKLPMLLSGLNECTVANNVCHTFSSGATDVIYGGIRLKDTYRSTITGNTVKDGSLNSVALFEGGGLYIETNCDHNTISNNVIHNVTNIGAGTGYGIRIENANCNKNIVIGNIALSCDNNFDDNGTNTETGHNITS